MCRGRFCGEPRRGAAAGGGRAQPAGARAAGPLRGVGAGALWWGRMVRGGRPAGAPAEGRGRGRPGAAPTPPQAAARRAVGAGEMLGRGRGGCGGGAGAGVGRVRGWGGCGGAGRVRGCGAGAGVRVGAPQGPAHRAGRGRAKPGLGRKENGYSWSCSPTSRSRTMPPVAGRFLVRRRWSLGTMPGT